MSDGTAMTTTTPRGVEGMAEDGGLSPTGEWPPSLVQLVSDGWRLMGVTNGWAVLRGSTMERIPADTGEVHERREMVAVRVVSGEVRRCPVEIDSWDWIMALRGRTPEEIRQAREGVVGESSARLAGLMDQAKRAIEEGTVPDWLPPDRLEEGTSKP